MITYAKDKGWGVGSYMCFLYDLKRREGLTPEQLSMSEREWFVQSDRDLMVKVIRQLEKTCLAFKILGASRNCQTPEATQASFDYAFSNLIASFGT